MNPNESVCPDAGRADQDRRSSREDPGQRGWRRQVQFGGYRHRTIRHRLPLRRPRPQGHLHLRPEMLLCRWRSEDDDLSRHVTQSFRVEGREGGLSHRSRTLRAESSAGGKVPCSLCREAVIHTDRGPRHWSAHRIQAVALYELAVPGKSSSYLACLSASYGSIRLATLAGHHAASMPVKTVAAIAERRMASTSSRGGEMYDTPISAIILA